MASIYKVGKRWRAQVLIRGQRQGQVFDTKTEASQWALQVQAEGRKAPSSTVLLKDGLGTLAALESRLDKLSLLPSDLGQKTSAVAGRLRSIMGRTQWVATNIRTTAPADYEAQLSPYIKSMREALSDLRDVLDYAHGYGF